MPRTGQTLRGFAIAGGDTADWVERSARIGYFAKGVVYLVVGGLAAAAAFGTGGQTTGSEGALQTILRQPFGRVLLSIVALGLIGYVFWRFVQGAADVEHKGSDAEGLVTRGYYLLSALTYSALVVTAVRMVIGAGGGSSDGTEQQTATLMSQPFGRWLVGLVGLGVIAAAFHQWSRAWKASFRKRMAYNLVSPDTATWLVRLGRAGLAARGVVFAIIGGFLVSAAVRADPDQAKGLGEVLATLERQPYGPWLLAAVAIGLVLYGAHQLAKARLRRVG
ncbi:MAG TPA: DUF1206 domain-containing protein [Thermoanaerobaculia bacterium]|nr:DUF1206 domain-containing protein [Thermoanaerobaculia bacterium]